MLGVRKPSAAKQKEFSERFSSGVRTYNIDGRSQSVTHAYELYLIGVQSACSSRIGRPRTGMHAPFRIANQNASLLSISFNDLQ